MDAALNYDSNSAYLFKGNEYVRYNKKTDKISAPKSIKANWAGVRFIGEAKEYGLKALQGTDPSHIEKFPVMKHYNHNTAATSTPTLIGETLIPFILVKDKNRSWQYLYSPYYKLSRYGFWKRVSYQVFSGDEKYKKTSTTEVGVIKKSSKSVEDTLGIGISASASFTYGASIGIEAKLNRELKVTTSASAQKMVKQSTKIETQPPGRRVTIAKWFRVDSYVLTRVCKGVAKKENIILQYEVVDRKTSANDAFPPKK